MPGTGLVTTQKIGRVRTVQVDAAGLRTPEAWLTARRTRVEGQLDRLAALVERTSEPSTPEEE
jgi:hypothetical protein